MTNMTPREILATILALILALIIWLCEMENSALYGNVAIEIPCGIALVICSFFLPESEGGM